LYVFILYFIKLYALLLKIKSPVKKQIAFPEAIADEVIRLSLPFPAKNDSILLELDYCDADSRC
jgi:hypothetical protein